MHEVNALLNKYVDCVFYNQRVPECERHDSALKRNKEALTAELRIWEDHLKNSNGKFLTGKNFDAVVFPAVAIQFRMGVCEQKYPKLAEYYNNLKTRPSIQKTWPPTWKDTPGQTVLKDI